MKYIAYGSNMNASQMEYLCKDAKLLGTGYIEYARLEFCLHATVVRTERQEDRVPVAVWEINEANEQRLDRFEGFPRYYIKDEWLAHMDSGEAFTGMIYLMRKFRLSPPEGCYYDCIRGAYDKLGLRSQINTVLEPALKRSLERDAKAPRPEGR